MKNLIFIDIQNDFTVDSHKQALTEAIDKLNKSMVFTIDKHIQYTVKGDKAE